MIATFTRTKTGLFYTKRTIFTAQYAHSTSLSTSPIISKFHPKSTHFESLFKSINSHQIQPKSTTQSPQFYPKNQIQSLHPFKFQHPYDNLPKSNLPLKITLIPNTKIGAILSTNTE